MTSMGLNWQHCQHTVFFPTWSYEQYTKPSGASGALVQQHEVTCDMVISEGQERVMEALEQKTEKGHSSFTETLSKRRTVTSRTSPKISTKPFNNLDFLK